jgi:hypothetical protein
LRRPVRAARTLCTCHPVAAVKSLIAAPSGRSSRPSMIAFFDWRIGTVTEPALALAGEAVAAGARFACRWVTDLRSVLRGRCFVAPVAVAFVVLGMI